MTLSSMPLEPWNSCFRGITHHSARVMKKADFARPWDVEKCTRMFPVCGSFSGTPEYTSVKSDGVTAPANPFRPSGKTRWTGIQVRRAEDTCMVQRRGDDLSLACSGDCLYRWAEKQLSKSNDECRHRICGGKRKKACRRVGHADGIAYRRRDPSSQADAGLCRRLSRTGIGASLE